MTEVWDWFDGLSGREKERWLDAWSTGDVVQDEMVDTLPEEHRPDMPDQWVRRSALWSDDEGRNWSTRLYMTDKLREFFGEESRRRTVAGQSSGQLTAQRTYSRAAMGEWFPGLGKGERIHWLDTATRDGDVSQCLLDTLPAERQPGTPGEALGLNNYDWWIVAGNERGPSYRIKGELREFLAMWAWFYGNDLREEDREGWLDAAWSPDSVPAELVDTLPAGRYSRRLSSEPPPWCWVFASGGSSGSSGPGTILYYRLTTELQEFLAREQERLRGAPPG